MKKVLHTSPSRKFSLISENVRNPNKVGKGKRYYTIAYHGWGEVDEVRAIVDPKHNISNKNAHTWRFKDINAAKKKWTMLMLKWA